MILPKFYCSIPSAHFRIVDNDTFKEVTTLFQRVIPQVLRKNKVSTLFIINII